MKSLSNKNTCKLFLAGDLPLNCLHRISKDLWDRKTLNTKFHLSQPQIYDVQTTLLQRFKRIKRTLLRLGWLVVLSENNRFIIALTKWHLNTCMNCQKNKAVSHHQVRPTIIRSGLYYSQSKMRKTQSDVNTVRREVRKTYLLPFPL